MTPCTTDCEVTSASATSATVRYEANTCCNVQHVFVYIWDDPSQPFNENDNTLLGSKFVANSTNGSTAISLSPSATYGDFVAQVVHVDTNLSVEEESSCLGTF